jgi:two-component system, chemotaxis family, CheB/CheR fusion protein
MPTKSKKESSRTRTATAEPIVIPATEADDGIFPIVGVGASAGGLEPFLQLLRAIGDAPGMAFIYVLHQDRHHENTLAEVVKHATKMKVQTAADGMTIEPEHVYVAPASADVHLSDGKIELQQRPREGVALPIDALFTSLGSDQGARAIAVILSGSGSDGARGSRALKAAGGIVFAQDDSAEFRQMPHAAVASGSVDFVLSASDIAGELLRIASHSYLTVPIAAGRRLPEGQLLQVFRLLHGSHDVDFTHYKPTTVERRIRRRMAVHKLEDLGDYVTKLRDDPKELDQLYSEILIRVTGFFRDPEVFENLRKKVAPLLIEQRTADDPVRVWVPGCSTGEEVYSLAITLFEAAGDLSDNCSFQIFGTDISDVAVERARLGFYPENIAGEVSAERLRRFFTRSDGGYRISKAIRDCCVFARQNVTRDPPFSRLDLISCRNVMIYLGPVLQRKVMSIFHYALRHDGYLLLGSSETIGNFADLFAVFDRQNRIYRKKPAGKRRAIELSATVMPRERDLEPAAFEPEADVPSNVFHEADRVLLTHYAPAGVLINESMEILQFRGRTSPFLEPAPGVASFNLLKMAREGLLSDLRGAILGARHSDAPVRREGLRIRHDGAALLVNIEVIPFLSPARERYQLVLFEEAKETPGEKKKQRQRQAAEDPGHIENLKRELAATREYLQSIIEEQEAMNEELRSANEEIQSSNEELQSTNEELETAKEELQSSNEELTTLNEELENRNQELAEVNNDLINLLAAIDIPVVILDSGLRIRRFNAGAQRALNLIPTDAGRSLKDLKTSLVLDDLDSMISGVIETLEVREEEVLDRSGRSHLLRIRPYKTTDNKIDGAVLVLIDIEQWRRG